MVIEAHLNIFLMVARGGTNVNEFFNSLSVESVIAIINSLVLEAYKRSIGLTLVLRLL